MKTSHALVSSALLAAALATSAPAAGAQEPLGELVSRATGADGRPFARSFLHGASKDGRYVLFAGPYAEAASAEPDDRLTLFVRDRETETTTPVMRADGALGVVWPFLDDDARGLDVSDDGTKVLFKVRQRVDGPFALYVRDVAAGTTTAVGDLPSGQAAAGVVGTARFVDGGEGVLYGAADAAGAEGTYERTLPSGAPTVVFDGLAATSASANGDVVTWSRPLVPAKRPGPVAGPGWPKEWAGVATGYKVKGQPARLVARTKVIERNPSPAPFCASASPTTTITTPRLLVDDSGTSLFNDQKTAFSAYPARESNELLDLGATGRRAMFYFTSFRGSYIRFENLAQATDLPTLPTTSSVWPPSGGLFFADDTGLLLQEYRSNDGRPETVNGIFAHDPVDEAAPVAPGVPAAQPGETADSPSLTPEVPEWADCPAPVPPKVTDFVTARYNAPFGSLKPIGDLTVDPHPRMIDGWAKKVTFTVKTFGFTTWSKTIDAPQVPTTVTVPKPHVFLPGTLTVSATVVTPEDQVGKTLSFSKSWFVWR